MSAIDRVSAHAKVAGRIARAVPHAIPSGISGITAAQWVIPSFDGEDQEIHIGPPGHYLPAVQAIARAVVDSSEALEAIRDWNASVTPEQDALRFVNKWR